MYKFYFKKKIFLKNQLLFIIVFSCFNYVFCGDWNNWWAYEGISGIFLINFLKNFNHYFNNF